MASQENQSGKANGGLVAAKNMSSAARSQRASKAAAARWRKEKEKEPPYEGPLMLNGEAQYRWAVASQWIAMC